MIKSLLALTAILASTAALADNGFMSCATNAGGVKTRATLGIDEIGSPIKKWDWSLDATYTVDGKEIKETLDPKNAKYEVTSYSDRTGKFEITVTAEKSASGAGVLQAVMEGSTELMENAERGGTITLYLLKAGKRVFVAKTFCSNGAD